MSGVVDLPELDILDSRHLSVANSDTVWNWNPLDCILCEKQLLDPVSLPCHHVFCRACLQARAAHGGVKCPLCAHLMQNIEERNGDAVVNFMVQSANETSDVCANCDKISQPMFFCSTCQQALCQVCKDQTHQAKMFAAHKLVPHEERVSLRGKRLCDTHEEPFILFSTESKRLICVNCFRKASTETRAHYVDLDVGHSIGCEKLDRAANKLKRFQQELKEQIQLRLKLLDELENSYDTQTNQMQLTCQQIIDAILQVRDSMLQTLSDERREREHHFKSDLRQLCGRLPATQLYLLGSSILCSSASKQDFLGLAYDLIRRMQHILNEQSALKPQFTGQLEVNYKDRLASALEPFLGINALFLPPNLEAGERSGSGTDSPSYARRAKRSGSGYVNCPSSLSISKYQLMVDLAGAFGEEFVRIESPINDYASQLATLSKQVQEMQRDITCRRCIINQPQLETLRNSCTLLSDQLVSHSTLIHERQPHLQQIWQEQLDRVRRQQIVFRQKVEQSLQIRSDLSHVLKACNQLVPFVSSISLAASAIDPKRCRRPDPAPMEIICSQITSLEPNSTLRVNAIEKEEQNRKEREQQRQQNNINTLLKAKKHLKTPKDHQHRKPKPPSSRHAVGRDRSRGGTDPGLLSPAKRHSKNSASSTKGEEDTASELSSLDDSFEQVVAIVQGQEIEKEHTQVLSRSATVQLPAPSQSKEANPLPQLSSSLPDEEHLNSAMTSLHVTDSSLAERKGVSHVPATVIRIAAPEQVQAKEKMLQSLKEKVPRIEIGVSNSPVREIPELGAEEENKN